MYQTLPARSWAYQSNVRSSGFPPAHTLSSTTVAVDAHDPLPVAGHPHDVQLAEELSARRRPRPCW